jgi:hypothetical protein
MHYSNDQNGVSPPASTTLSKSHTHMYWNDSVGQNSNLEEPHRPNVNFLECQISLAALIQVSTPQTYDKRTFRSVAHWHFLLNELCPQKVSNSRISLRTPNYKTPTNLTVDGCPSQAQAFECLTPPAVTLVRSFTAKRNVSPWARSGFEPESPVHYRTSTCNAGYNFKDYFYINSS